VELLNAKGMVEKLGRFSVGRDAYPDGIGRDIVDAVLKGDLAKNPERVALRILSKNPFDDQFDDEYVYTVLLRERPAEEVRRNADWVGSIKVMRFDFEEERQEVDFEGDLTAFKDYCGYD